MLGKFLLLATLLLLSVSSSRAQVSRPPASATDNKIQDKLPKDDKHDADFPNEMLKKMEIARKEIEYKKVLEDVGKLSDLTNEVVKSYDEQKRISPEDVKRLGAIEKLAKHVLTGVGGEEVGDKSSEAANMTLADAVGKLNAAAENIRKEMKTETRFVVSASVIANSNDVISLTRFIRHNQKAN